MTTRWTGVSSAGSSMPEKSSPVGFPPSSTTDGCVSGDASCAASSVGVRRLLLLLDQVGDDHQGVVGPDTELVVLGRGAEQLGGGRHGGDPGAVRRAGEQLAEHVAELVAVRDRLRCAVVVVAVDVLLGGAVAHPQEGAHGVTVRDRVTGALDQGRHGRGLRLLDLGVPRGREALTHVAAERDLGQLARGARTGRGLRGRCLAVASGLRPTTGRERGNEQGSAQGCHGAMHTSRHGWGSLVEDGNRHRSHRP